MSPRLGVPQGQGWEAVSWGLQHLSEWAGWVVVVTEREEESERVKKNLSHLAPWVVLCGPQSGEQTGEPVPRGQVKKTPQLPSMGKMWKFPGWNDPGSSVGPWV